MDSSEQTLRLFLPITPVANKRHRTAKSGHTYDPNMEDKDLYVRAVKVALREMNQHEWSPIQGPISLELEFWFSPPVSYSQKKRIALLSSLHTKKPDLDNLVKMMDAFNGVLWIDDCQIYSIQAKKSHRLIDGILMILRYQDSSKTSSCPSILLHGSE